MFLAKWTSRSDLFLVMGMMGVFLLITNPASAQDIDEPDTRPTFEVSTFLAKPGSSQNASAVSEAIGRAKAKRDMVGEAALLQLSALKYVQDASNAYQIDRNVRRTMWQQAIQAWRSTGDGPGLMDAYCCNALRLDHSATMITRKMNIVLALARLESRRPIAACRVLNYYAMALAPPPVFDTMDFSLRGSMIFWISNVGEDELSDLPSQMLLQACTILQKRGPRSLEMVAVLNNLGILCYQKSDYRQAKNYFVEAQQLVPERERKSTAYASILYHLSLIAFKEGNQRQQRELYEAAHSAMTADVHTLNQTLRPDMSNIPQGPLTQSVSTLSDEPVLAFSDTCLAVAENEAGRSETRYLTVISWPRNYTAIGSMAGNPILPEQRLQMSVKQVSPISTYAMDVIAKRVPPLPDEQRYASINKQIEDLRQHLGPTGGIESIAQSMQRFGFGPNRFGGGASMLPNTLPNLQAQTPEDQATDQRLLPVPGKTVSFQLGIGMNYMADYWQTMAEGRAAVIVSALLKQNQKEEAWECIENLHADEYQHALMEHLLFKGPLAKGIPLALRDSAADFYQEIGTSFRFWEIDQEFQSRFKHSFNAPETNLQLLRQSLEQAEEEDKRVEDLQGRLEVAQIHYSQMSAKAVVALQDLPKPSSPKSELKEMSRGSVYISFCVGFDQTFAFVAQADGTIIAYRVPIPQRQLYTLTDTLARKVSDRSSAIGDITKLGQETFRTLFSPDQQKVITAATHLVISSDGFLWRLPFSCLVTAEAGGMRFLGCEKSLTFTQSLALLHYTPDTPKRPQKDQSLSTLVVGVSHFDSATHLPDLPQAETEAKDIAKLYQVQPLLGPQATEMAVRSRLEQADIVHIATHGYLASNPLVAMSSGLYLTVPHPVSSSVNDGILQAWELVSQVSLRANIVVLSACDVAGGTQGYSDGLGHVVRALQMAGAKSIVASQWHTDDTKAPKWMHAFHSGLREGLPKDDALRNASRILSSTPSTAHPYYWAGYILVGDPAPINIAQP